MRGTRRQWPSIHGRQHGPGREDPIPGPWRYVGDTGEPAFENSWDNVGGGMRRMSYRESGLGDFEFRGVVTGGTPPSVVFTLDPVLWAFLLPDESEPFAGVAGGTWQLDPDGSVWIIQ